MATLVKRIQTTWWHGLIYRSGFLLIANAIPSTVFVAVTLSGKLALEHSETLLFGGYLIGIEFFLGFVLLFAAERISKQSLFNSEPVSSLKKYCEIARLAMAWGCLFLAIFWAQEIVRASHSDHWGVAIVKYLAICLTVLSLLYIPFRLITKYDWKRVALICANIGCWLLIFPLVASCISYGIHLWNIWGTITDGNDYFDPLVFILNYVTPLTCYGVGGLFFLWRHAFTKGRFFVLATALLTILTLGLVSFGVFIFHGQEQPWRLSCFVWWFEPFRVFGL
jgi:hypothetical protein